jgi:hypothetical protein
VSTATLIFETNPLTGFPSLRQTDGAASPFTDAELREMERELQSRYERLARLPGSTVRLRAQEFTVEVQEGRNKRQPTLVLRPTATLPLATLAPAWTAGLLAELTAAASDPALPRFEAQNLHAVVGELRELADRPVELAALLLGGYLACAEQHYRGDDSDRAAAYRLALRGLERLVPESEPDTVLASPPADAPARPAAEEPAAAPASGWLRKFLAWARMV